jgi:hypothetical protein
MSNIPQQLETLFGQRTTIKGDCPKCGSTLPETEAFAYFIDGIKVHCSTCKSWTPVIDLLKSNPYQTKEEILLEFYQIVEKYNVDYGGFFLQYATKVKDAFDLCTKKLSGLPKE